MTVTIADLFPYELGATTSKVELQKKLIPLNKMSPIKVLKVDGHWLVVDGANRVVAAKELGQTTIEATEVFREVHEMPFYRECVSKAHVKGWRGYGNYPKSETVPPRPGLAPPPPVPRRAAPPPRGHHGHAHHHDHGHHAPARPAHVAPPRAYAPTAQVDPNAILRVVKTCMTRERYRLASIIHEKRWVIRKADGGMDVDASMAKLSEMVIDASQDALVFAAAS